MELQVEGIYTAEPRFEAKAKALKLKQEMAAAEAAQRAQKEKQYAQERNYGGGFGDIKQSPSSKAINKYLSNETIRYKKILVVADSLRKVMEKIEPRLRDWYIMVDEIDSYQSDSTYRNRALGWVMDYFFKFPERQRCLVSATMRPFSNPEILKMPVIEVNFR